MALKRFRPAHYRDRYVVLDHGEPNADGEYVQDGDPEDPSTTTQIAWSLDVDPDDVDAKRAANDEAHAEADRLNREDARSRPIPAPSTELPAEGQLEGGEG